MYSCIKDLHIIISKKTTKNEKTEIRILLPTSVFGIYKMSRDSTMKHLPLFINSDLEFLEMPY